MADTVPDVSDWGEPPSLDLGIADRPADEPLGPLAEAGMLELRPATRCQHSLWLPEVGVMTALPAIYGQVSESARAAYDGWMVSLVERTEHVLACHRGCLSIEARCSDGRRLHEAERCDQLALTGEHLGLDRVGLILEELQEVSS